MNEAKVGSYTGTGAAINLSLGFVPQYLRVWNETDGDICWEWFKGMADGSALQITNHASTQVSKITSNGVTAYEGSSTAGKGVTIGTALSENSKTFRYVAIRGGDGAQG